MPVLVVGLSHKTAPVDVRDRVAVPAGETKSALESLARVEEVDECALISTCNRTEAYAVTQNPDIAGNGILRFFCDRSGMTATELNEHLFTHSDIDAVRHLFGVSAGLHSMIVGEPQIAGQVKDAGSLALETRCSSRILNRLFRSAVETSKRARTETEIGSGAVSISFAAVELARKIFGDLSGKTVLVLGAGEMSELTARHLIDNGVEDLWVASRTKSRAEELATAVQGNALGWDEGIEALYRADIVISSTSAPTPILRQDQVTAAMQRRRNRQMFLIDIAVPRDIAPDVADVYNVLLYDIDDLQAVVGENIQKRSGEAEKSRGIVEEEVAGFEGWLASLDVQPAVVALRQAFHEVMTAELERAKLTDLTDEQRERVALLLRQFTNKLLHAPTTRLKASAEQGEGAAHVDSLIQLFDLSEAIRDGLGGDRDARKVES